MYREEAWEGPYLLFFIYFFNKKYVQGGGRRPQGEKEKELSETTRPITK
jgi:hypothetical protein